MMKFFIAILIVLIGLQLQTQTNSWKLVWQDDFNYQGLPDSAKWNYDVGDHGWGNNEKQNYTFRNIENARVNGKYLVLEALKTGNRYTSARLVTRGKGFWKYGKVEIRAKLPQGLGSWPAIWMLANDMKTWPDDGEIDIMEHVGYDPGVVHASVHTKNFNHIIGTQKTNKIFVKNVSKKFHTYSVEWDEDKLAISIDNKILFTFLNEHRGYQFWPFDNPMYLILNIAVGGNWGGKNGFDDSTMPWKMVVDYVRVYQRE